MATKPYLPEEDARFTAVETITSVAVKNNVSNTVSGTFALTDGTHTLTIATAAVKLTGLANADPHIAGALWSNSSVVTVSAG